MDFHSRYGKMMQITNCLLLQENEIFIQWHYATFITVQIIRISDPTQHFQTTVCHIMFECSLFRDFSCFYLFATKNSTIVDGYESHVTQRMREA